jgi:hypothetical protein
LNVEIYVPRDKVEDAGDREWKVPDYLEVGGFTHVAGVNGIWLLVYPVIDHLDTNDTHQYDQHASQQKHHFQEYDHKFLVT